MSGTAPSIDGGGVLPFPPSSDMITGCGDKTRASSSKSSASSSAQPSAIQALPGGSPTRTSSVIAKPAGGPASTGLGALGRGACSRPSDGNAKESEGGGRAGGRPRRWEGSMSSSARAARAVQRLHSAALRYTGGPRRVQRPPRPCRCHPGRAGEDTAAKEMNRLQGASI